MLGWDLAESSDLVLALCGPAKPATGNMPSRNAHVFINLLRSIPHGVAGSGGNDVVPSLVPICGASGYNQGLQQWQA